MRWLAVLLVLSGCAGGEDVRPVVAGLWSKLRGAEPEAAEPAGKATLTRAQIDALGAALIQVNLDGDAHWPVLGAVAQNGDYVTYASRARQTVTLRESQVTATRGYGTDLVSATSSAGDPLAVPTPPGSWPAGVMREYRFGGGPEGRLERYDCAFVRAGAATIEIAGTPFDVVGFAENCSGPAGTFQNLHAADATTGRVWQTRQWIGPDVPALTVEVLEPVTQ